MHELGIVFYIIRDVKQVAEANHVEHVASVVMDIGEVSTVVPHLLSDCWRWAADKEPMLQGCELEVNTIPAVTGVTNARVNIPPSPMAAPVHIAAAATHGCSVAMKWKYAR